MARKRSVKPIDAPLYSYWQALYLSFYSKNLYVDVDKRWQGYGVLYFLFVILIFAIPLAIRILVNFNDYFDEQMLKPIESFPKMMIQNGEISITEKTPYLIKNNKGEIVAIIDPSGKTKFDKTYPALSTLITKDKIYFRPPKFQLFFSGSNESPGDTVYVQPVPKKANEIFYGENWIKQSGILKLKWLTDVLIYPVISIFIFSFYLVFMLFIAILGQVFSLSIIKLKLTFQEACRLLFVASTPQLFLFFVFLFFNTVPSGIGFFYIALLAVYFYYGALSIKKERNKLVKG